MPSFMERATQFPIASTCWITDLHKDIKKETINENFCSYIDISIMIYD